MAERDGRADKVGSGEGGSKAVSRRDFLATAGLAGAGSLTGITFLLSKDNPPEPERKKQPVRVGFIGVGSRGGALLRAALKVPGSQVTAVADVEGEAVDAAVENIRERDGKEFEVFATDDYRKLLRRDDVQAVVIATPHFLHGPMAMDALEAGKHVYVEKAMAFTIGECLDLYRMARELEKKQVFQVGHQRHYSKLYRKVRDLVQEGKVGNVTAIRAQWNRNDQVSRPTMDPRNERLVNWRLYSEYSGGLMTEFASHQIDVANMVLAMPPAKPGDPKKIVFPHSVCGMGGMDHPRSKRQKGRDTSDNVHVVYTYRVPFREWQEIPDGVDPCGNPVIRKVFVPRRELYAVRFAYMSIMTNELLGPSEMIFGDEGTIEVSLAGADRWIEQKSGKKASKDLKTGASIAAVKKGVRPPDESIAIGKDRTDWTDFVGKIVGEHSPQETLLALDGFLTAIRSCMDNQPYQVAANAEVGLGGSLAAILGNLAMKEGRTLYWRDFVKLPELS